MVKPTSGPKGSQAGLDRLVELDLKQAVGFELFRDLLLGQSLISCHFYFLL